MIQSPRPINDVSQNLNNYDFYNELVKLRGQIVDITDTGVLADTEFSVLHGYNRVPTNVEILVKEGQTDAYLLIKPSGTAWTNKLVYLKCNTANAAIRIRVT